MKEFLKFKNAHQNQILINSISKLNKERKHQMDVAEKKSIGENASDFENQNTSKI